MLIVSCRLDIYWLPGTYHSQCLAEVLRCCVYLVRLWFRTCYIYVYVTLIPFYPRAQLVYSIGGFHPQATFWTSRTHRCLPFSPSRYHPFLPSSSTRLFDRRFSPSSDLLDKPYPQVSSFFHRETLVSVGWLTCPPPPD